VILVKSYGIALDATGRFIQFLDGSILIKRFLVVNCCENGLSHRITQKLTRKRYFGHGWNTD